MMALHNSPLHSLSYEFGLLRFYSSKDGCQGSQQETLQVMMRLTFVNQEMEDIREAEKITLSNMTSQLYDK